MGANSPSTTQYAHKIIDSLKSFFKLLPPTAIYRNILKKYAEYILKQRSAIHYATEYLPILAALIVIQVERDISYAEELTKVYKEIDELRRQIERARPSE